MSDAPATPSWLLAPEVGLCPCGCIGKRRRSSFIEKTIQGAANVLAQALFNEDVATLPGLLQRLDARTKLVSLLVLLVATALVRHIVVLVGLYALTLVLAAASRISLAWFIKRVWLFIPIFTGIIVIPAMFSFITPGHIVLILGHWLGHEVGITQQGLTAAGLIVTRVATSISLVVLMTLTTPWPRLLAALRALLVPRMFVLVIGMAYRYIFVLIESVSDMYTARKSRTFGAGEHTKQSRAFVAASAGALFGKAHSLSEEIHQAMVARGYRGDVRTLERFSFAWWDAAWALACLGLVAIVLGGDHPLGS
jgi:cobalt/nickel transport system permease protein